MASGIVPRPGKGVEQCCACPTIMAQCKAIGGESWAFVRAPGATTRGSDRVGSVAKLANGRDIDSNSAHAQDRNRLRCRTGWD
jgi:hypothetical protein